MEKKNIFFLADNRTDVSLVGENITEEGFGYFDAPYLISLEYQVKEKEIPFFRVIIGDGVKPDREMRELPDGSYLPIELSKRIRELCPGAPICFLSSFLWYSVKGTTITDSPKIRDLLEESNITVIERDGLNNPIQELKDFLR